MQELINNHIRGIKGFAEEYGIPYNTVRQWENGTRSAPKWLTKIFYSLRTTQGIKQIEISEEIYQVYKTIHESSEIEDMYIGKINDGMFNATKNFWKIQAKKDEEQNARHKVIFEEFKVMRIKEEKTK